MPSRRLVLVSLLSSATTVTDAFSYGSRVWLRNSVGHKRIPAFRSPELWSAKKKEEDDKSILDLTVDEKAEKALAEELGGDTSFLKAPVTDDGVSEQEAREEEIAAILEMGGDPSFLMDEAPPRSELAGDAEDDDGISQQEAREEEIAAILEMGGDPSFFMDAPESKRNDSKEDDALTISKQEAREEEIAAILEMGGDPSFFMDAPPEPKSKGQFDSKKEALEEAGGDSSFLSDDTNESQEPPNQLDENKQDWFGIGRQMAKDFLNDVEEDEDESSEDTKKETSWKNASPDVEEAALSAALDSLASSGRDQDPLPLGPSDDTTMGEDSLLEQAQSASLRAARSLVVTAESLCQVKQEALLACQNDIETLQAKLKELQEQEARLQLDLTKAKADQEESRTKEQAIQSAFAALGALPPPTVDDAKKEALPPKEGPYYSAMEGEAFDSVQDEVEALGGDPFFLVDEDDDNDGEPESSSTLTPGLASAPDPSFLLNLVEKDEDTQSTTKSSFEENKQRKKTTTTRGLRKSALTNEVEEEENLTLEEQLLDVGGDPAFLDSYDANDEAYDLGLTREEIEELGGDPSFL